MKTILKSALFFAIFGLCLSAAAIRAQITNPTYALLNLEAYRAYYPFYMLGARLDDFVRLGALTSGLVLISWALWATNSVGLRRYLTYSRGGEPFSWAWRAAMLLAVSVVGSVVEIGLSAAVSADLLSHPLHGVHLAMLLLPTALALLAASALDRTVAEHRLLVWPLVLLSLVGSGLTFYLLDIATQIETMDYLIAPLLSTHYGPWAILGWVSALGALLGTAIGIMLYGLTPSPNAEPDNLRPVPSQRLGQAFLGSLCLAAILLAVYPLYLVPRFQIGGDLRGLLDLKQGQVPGRTVVWLDSYSPPHTIEPFTSWSTPENLAKVRDWIVRAPSPSALTRPAAQGLGNHALWQWRPEEALDWVEVQRRRQRYSNLNRVFLQVLQSSKPSPAYAHHLDALTNPDRFAWPGPGSRLEIAAQLRRYGRQSQASQWLNEARLLGSDSLPPHPGVVPEGTLKGRLDLDGKPLAGVRVALFRGTGQDELLERTDRHVRGEKELMECEWRPTYYQYMDLFRLQDFYAVETTDADGRFLFESVDTGVYRLAVRLETEASYPSGASLPTLAEAQDLDLGTLSLTSEH